MAHRSTGPEGTHAVVTVSPFPFEVHTNPSIVPKYITVEDTSADEPSEGKDVSCPPTTTNACVASSKPPVYEPKPTPAGDGAPIDVSVAKVILFPTGAATALCPESNVAAATAVNSGVFLILSFHAIIFQTWPKTVENPPTKEYLEHLIPSTL